MDIKVSAPIVVKVGDQEIKLSRFDARKLIKLLQEELGEQENPKTVTDFLKEFEESQKKDKPYIPNNITWPSNPIWRGPHWVPRETGLPYDFPYTVTCGGVVNVSSTIPDIHSKK